MTSINTLLEVIRQVMINLFTIKVPGFNFTFWELTVTIVLICFGISLLRFILGLPIEGAASNIKGDVKRNMK